MIEAALALCLLGVVLAAFVPTFVRRVRTSKIAEAPLHLRRLQAAASSYYGARHGPEARLCLPPKAGPAPAEPSQDPVEVDLSADGSPGHETWAALGFEAEHPLRFRYTFEPSSHGCGIGLEGPATVTLRAEGDLDGDGQLSLFERTAVTDAAGQLKPQGILYIDNRVE